MLRTPKLLPRLAIAALVLVACSESNSVLPTAPAADGATAVTQANRDAFPPDGWIFLPESLDSGFTKWECTFGFPDNLDPEAGPHRACQEKEWGNSGVFREQIRDMVAIGPLAQQLCGGPAHFDEIRLCSLAWIDGPETPWGPAGTFGCVLVSDIELVCGVG